MATEKTAATVASASASAVRARSLRTHLARRRKLLVAGKPRGEVGRCDVERSAQFATLHARNRGACGAVRERAGAARRAGRRGDEHCEGAEDVRPRFRREDDPRVGQREDDLAIARRGAHARGDAAVAQLDVHHAALNIVAAQEDRLILRTAAAARALRDRAPLARCAASRGSGSGARSRERGRFQATRTRATGTSPP